ncbi:MAG: hypothetical protein JNK82_37490 [Myxococcaceae bacterium]|nr:hypothetical protein [Myxococcaceae bacterium]
MNLRPLATALSSLLASGCLVIQTGPGPEEGKAYCVKNKASGACVCTNYDPGLGSDTEYVPNCDVVPSDATCCADVNGDGESTGCRCLRPLCVTDTDTGNCMCKHFEQFVVGNSRDNEQIISAGTCQNTTCCRDSSSCGCYNASNIICNDQKVTSCALSALPAKLPCNGGDRPVTSCAGLKWKK